MRRALSFLPMLVLGGAAFSCAVAFSPGDYQTTTDAGSPVGVGADGAPLPPGSLDGATASKHLVIVAGERDGPNGVGNEVWLAPISAAGDIGEFAPQQGAYFSGAAVAYAVSDGKLFVATKQGVGTVRAIEFVDFANGINGSWYGAVAPVPLYGSYGLVFAHANLLALGGGSFTDAEGETPSPVFDNRIQVMKYASTPEPGTFTGPYNLQDPAEGGVVLPAGMRDMATIAYKDFVYMVGGAGEDPDANAFWASRAWVAKADPTSGVTAFTELGRVTNPEKNQPYNTNQPILCTTEGYLIVAGGADTDIVLTAKISETDGSLSEWKKGKSLPGTLRAAGCAIFNGKIHLFGGLGTTSRTDRILRADFADGTVGDWEILTDRKLPGARSSVVAVVY